MGGEKRESNTLLHITNRLRGKWISAVQKVLNSDSPELRMWNEGGKNECGWVLQSLMKVRNARTRLLRHSRLQNEVLAWQ